MSLMICRLGGTILLTRSMDMTYWAIYSKPGKTKTVLSAKDVRVREENLFRVLLAAHDTWFNPEQRSGVNYVSQTTYIRNDVAKPNYQFEKRQRELEKKRKKAEKALKKAPDAEPLPDAEASPAQDNPPPAANE